MRYTFLHKILLGFVFIIKIGYSQEIDSITVQQIQLQKRLWNQFYTNPSIYQLLPLTDFTETGLYGEFKNQPLSKRQNPNTINQYGFQSKGIFSLKNSIKLFGKPKPALDIAQYSQ